MKPEDLPDWPRLMKAELAARYIGVSPSTLRMGSKVGQYPAPLRDGKLCLWDRRLLDRWIDARSGLWGGST